MSAHAFCPRCGYDLEINSPVIINDFSMFGPGHPLCYRGNPVKLTHHEAEVCWTLMRAYPSLVKSSTLLDRIDSEGGPETTVAFISKIRRKLASVGIDDPIETIRRSGYRWKA